MKKNNLTLLNKISQSIYIRILLLAAVLALGAYLRFTGIEWDEDFHLHPDERFLTMVETSLSPVDSLKEYFDTSSSSLNPHNIVDANGNQSYPLFVYGDLPIIIVRYMGEWLGMAGYGSIYILGRILSGIFDIGTILLVFLIADRLFGKFWLSWLASFLYACSALPIQISHYFIVDNFTTFFSMLAFFWAVVVLKSKEENYSLVRPSNIFQWFKLNWSNLRPFVYFGVALGMAAASKINAIAIAIVLPLAVFLRNPRSFLRPASPGWTRRFHTLILAAVISFISFRIFQPYAFNGPGFFNISLNKEWIADLQELTVLSSGISNYPPSMQWAKRSVLFPLKNLTIWGLGIPFAIFAVGGMIWMTWKIIKGEWQKYSLPWIWTLFYVSWQAVRWNPTMRYFLLVYPPLAIVAAWCAVEAVKQINFAAIKSKWAAALRVINIAILVILVGGTACWALAFLQVYKKPMTRITASEWIYDNIEGAVNLKFRDNTESFLQALPYPHTYTLVAGKELKLDFQPEVDGSITSIYFDFVSSDYPSNTAIPLYLSIRQKGSNTLLAETSVYDMFLPESDSRGKEINAELAQPIEVSADEAYELVITLPENYSNLSFYGTVGIWLNNQDEQTLKQAVFESTLALENGSPYYFTFTPKRNAILEDVELFRIKDIASSSEDAIISVMVQDGEGGEILGQGSIRADLTSGNDYRGSNVIIELDEVLVVEENKRYSLTLNVEDEDAEILISGSEPAKETDWDDTLPLYMYGNSPFDYFDGVFQSELNFQMYWDDNQEKRERFLSILDQTDYIIITSNRQWGSVTQLPDEFPLTTLYYKELIGCTEDDVQYCYRVAEPGTYSGRLGFELEAVFQSNPEIFGIEFNSQFAEEAFTVYDHPKVLVFKKTEDFNLESVAEKFYGIDLDKIQSMNPEEAEDHKGDLMLSDNQLSRQKESGTWSEIFDYDALQNKYPVLTVMFWYLFITVLGWVFYPLGRIIFKGLTDKGFALLKLVGLIVWSFLVWWLGSIGVSVTRLTIFLVLLVCVAINALAAWKDWDAVKEELIAKKNQYIKVELIALAFFLFFLLVRIGNPDLWHPYKGGEKPMDFSYFNAVLKSDTFPPYDPWYADGYINYYYYGFVLAAVPVKLLGIVPSIAYNLILATFFSFTGMAAFTFGWNVFDKMKEKSDHIVESTNAFLKKIFHSPFALGITSALFVLIIGNLGTVGMIAEGFQKIALTSDPTLASGGIFQNIGLFFKGIVLFFSGTDFTYYPGDWYWIPSRVIPGEAITEFPYFTFLYGDPHAHLFAYPITILVLCWIMALLNNRMEYKNKLFAAVQVISGALFIGTLKPTNTWDYPVFLFTAVLVLAYVLIKYAKLPNDFFEYLPAALRKIIHTVLVIVIFAGLTYVLYYPFSEWFGQAYSSIQLWEGDHTPINSYLTHWGIFLFVLYSFLIWEMREWMATTPVSALKPFYEKRKLITAGLIILMVIFMFLIIRDVLIIVVIAPAILMLCMLFFRKDYSDLTRFIILITLAGLGLTLMVELIVIRGDIGRMNTVFKFYLQAWTFLALSSTYYLFHLMPAIAAKWNENWRNAWRVMLGLLLFSVILFPILASADKITDRMTENIPLTIDGMDFMQYSTYTENDTVMDLFQDYDAIRWVQDNISGTPVIIEGTVTEYKWGNRFTIYTGLPSVIGWNWHQRQQRAINSSDWVYERINDVNEFYQTDDLDRVKAIIKEYDIEYIIVGQLERAIYDSGLEKYPEQEGSLWNVVYSSGDTQIYQVKK